MCIFLNIWSVDDGVDSGSVRGSLRTTSIISDFHNQDSCVEDVYVGWGGRYRSAVQRETDTCQGCLKTAKLGHTKGVGENS